MQTVFRVKPAARKVTTKRPFKNRKPHTKSRGGCNACRERRMKCDEARPSCRQCIEKKIQCRYHEVRQYATPNADGHNLALQELATRVVTIVGSSIGERVLCSTKLLRDLQHFNEVTVFLLGMKENQQALCSIMYHVWSHPYLMHLTLALANAHAYYLYEDGSKVGQLAFARSLHWQVALQLYRKSLSRKANMPTSEDGLAASSYFVGVLGFCIDDDVPDDILNGDINDVTGMIEPLASAGSMPYLMRIFPEVSTKSTWRGIFKAIANSERPMPISDLPPAFVKLCNLTEDDHFNGNAHYRMLCHISPLLRQQPCNKHLSALSGLVGDLWPAIRTQAVAKEERTLLLLAWWLALFERLNLWWSTRRARTSIRAILAYLSAHGSAAVQPFLAFPAAPLTTDCSWIWSGSDRPEFVPLARRSQEACQFLKQ